MSVLEGLSEPANRRQLQLMAGVGVLAVALLIAAYFIWIRTPYSVLFSDLRASDAAAIVSHLEENNIRYELADGGARILVPQDLVDSTRLGIVSSDLPVNGAVGFEIFDRSDMGLTEFAQKINYQRALQGELARTIMTIAAVESARVHLALPEHTVFRDDRRPPKASISLTIRPGERLSPESVTGIQRLVASAISEMDPASVVVLDDTGMLLGGLAEATPSRALTERQAIEQYYVARLQRALTDVFPAEDIRVDVAVIGSAEALSTAGLSEWSPASRAFGLSVSVSIFPPLSAYAEEEVRNYVAEAFGFDPIRGDTIHINPIPTAGGQTGLPSDEVDVQADDSAAPLNLENRRSGVLLGISAILGILVVLGMMLTVMRRRSRPRLLSMNARGDLVRRLRSALEEDGDARPAN